MIMHSEEELQKIKEQLSEVTKLTRQNNKIMRKIQTSMRIGLIFRTLYWMLIIGSMLGAYYYLQPFLENISGTYEELINIPEKIKTFDLSTFEKHI